MTLPASGTTPTEKTLASKPGRARTATFFFARSNRTTLFGGQLNVDFVFECRMLREPSFVPCNCRLPPSSAYEMCHRVSGLQAAGREALFVRLTPLINQVRQSDLALPPAAYRWQIGRLHGIRVWLNFLTQVSTTDALPPTVTIAQYYDSNRTLLNQGPAPCVNPLTTPVTFELQSNEAPAAFECRMTEFQSDINGFRGMPSRWSVATTQAWLRLQSQAHPNLATTISSLVQRNISASVLLQSSAVVDNNISTVVNLLLAAQLPWKACGQAATATPVLVSYDATQLQPGLNQFEARVRDDAGNLAAPEQYRFFVGRCRAGTCTFLPSQGTIPRRRSGQGGVFKLTSSNDSWACCC